VPEQLWAVPRYFAFYQFPTKVVPRPDGRPTVWRFSVDTGGWDREQDALIEIESNSRAEVSRLDKDGFIQLTESFRSQYVQDVPPAIKALYETVEAILDQARAERRRLTAEENAMVTGLRRRTYAMFERELANRGDPGADPSPES